MGCINGKCLLRLSRPIPLNRLNLLQKPTLLTLNLSFLMVNINLPMTKLIQISAFFVKSYRHYVVFYGFVNLSLLSYPVLIASTLGSRILEVIFCISQLKLAFNLIEASSFSSFLCASHNTSYSLPVSKFGLIWGIQNL